MRNILIRNSLLGMTGPLIIWTVHFLFSYAIVSIACATDYIGTRFFGFDAVTGSIAVITLIAAALLAYIGIANFGKWRRSRDRSVPADSMSGFFALSSMLVCGLSAIALLWVAFPAFVLPPCAT